MKIGIDARLYDESGNGRYIRNLLANLQKIDSRNKYFIFLLKKDFDKPDVKNNFTKVLADIKWYGIREQVNFPTLLYKYNLDLVHFPHFNVPIFYRRNFVVTIHDLIHQHFGMQRATTHGRIIYSLKKLGYYSIFKHAIAKSEKIITVSNFVKKQLIDEWGINEEKVDVIYEAAEESIISIAKETTKLITQKPYIFYVGNAHPHKNVEGLIRAFLKLKEQYKNLTLMLAGKDHYFWQRIQKKYQQEGIKYLGYINDKELVSLYKSAVCYVISSFEEGFGIPMLEAFACGCPVAAADIGVLREIGEDAALYFDPQNTGDIVCAIKKLLDDGKLRKELIKKGNKRYKNFNWERLAKETLEVYENSTGT